MAEHGWRAAAGHAKRKEAERLQSIMHSGLAGLEMQLSELAMELQAAAKKRAAGDGVNDEADPEPSE